MSVHKTTNLHITIHIQDINPLLHVSAADSHNKEALPTLKLSDLDTVCGVMTPDVIT